MIQCIKIIDIPMGEAPDWIRQAWINLVLPRDLFNPYSLSAVGVISQEPAENGAGYCVESLIAIEILRLANPKAAAWWQENCPRLIEPGRRFVFNRLCCYVTSNTLPGMFGEKSDANTITVIEFLDQLRNSNTVMPNLFALVEALLANGKKDAPINRANVLWISRLTARDFRRQVDARIDEQMFDQTHQDGHACLRAIHELAVQNGVVVELAEIDQPLSYSDMMIMSGMVEVVDGGLVLTEKGRQLALELEKEEKGNGCGE